VTTATAVTALSTGRAAGDIAAAMRDLHTTRLTHLLRHAPADPHAAAHATHVGAAGRATLYRWHPQLGHPPSENHQNMPTAPLRAPLPRRWPGPWNLHNLHQACPPAGAPLWPRC
jgi:hypothetical protein